MAGEDWISTGEAARLLGVHRTTVVDYINRGLLPAKRLPTGRFRVRRADVLALLRNANDDYQSRKGR